MTTTTIEFVIPLHPGQRAIAVSPARYRIVAAGRRWGKSRLGAALTFVAAVEGGIAWWVAPTYAIASIGWRHMRRLSHAVPGSEVREGDRSATFPAGGWLQVRSADTPDNLRGEGLDLVVLDEAAFMRQQTWTEALRPALSDRAGRAVFLSTPNGTNWFHQLYARGQDPLEPDYASWNRPSWTSPYFSPIEREKAQHELPEDTFRQEYGAEFMDSTGAYFRGVRDAVADRVSGGVTYVGVDWGDRNDYTVMTALRGRHLVALERLNRSGYDYQLDRLRAFCAAQDAALVLVETNSMGTMTLERLRAVLGFPVQGFATTHASKRALLDALKLAIETRELTYPDLPVLLAELGAFRASVTPAGALTLAAPPGEHDDCVMSLALAWWAATRVAVIGSFADAGAYDAGPAGAPVGFRAL
jgi:hypothetical protein